jgi:putative molybdopterin biosynthesis protein
MGASYRHVWGAVKHWEVVLGQPLVHWVQGQPARLTPYALRLLRAERQARVRMTPHIEALRAELEHVRAQAMDERQQVLEVFASHDLALPLLRDLAAEHGLHLGLRFAGSVDALRALAAGRCSVAGFHVPLLPGGSPVFAAALKPLLKPGRHKLLGCLRRSQGLMLRPATTPRPTTLAEVAAARLRFLNRQPGSGTRLLMDHLLQEEKLDPSAIPGYLDHHEDTHVAVASAIAHGDADVGPGVEAAAHEAGLDFVPLADEAYYLVCLKPTLDTPAVRLLREVIASPRWAQALAGLTGYALPWWRFRQPRATATRPA